MKNNNDDYRIEEADDERTFGEGMISDLDKMEKEQLEKAETDLKCLEYVSEFYALINACGQVSYYMNMQYMVKENVRKAKVVAASYQHDFAYYKEQRISWTAKANRGFDILQYKANQIGYSIEEEKKTFLNNLALSKDRRECYKYYLNKYKEKGQLFSPDDLEKKYVQRVMKRK